MTSLHTLTRKKTKKKPFQRAKIHSTNFFPVSQCSTTFCIAFLPPISAPQCSTISIMDTNLQSPPKRVVYVIDFRHFPTVKTDHKLRSHFEGAFSYISCTGHCAARKKTTNHGSGLFFRRSGIMSPKSSHPMCAFITRMSQGGANKFQFATNALTPTVAAKSLFAVIPKPLF